MGKRDSGGAASELPLSDDVDTTQEAEAEYIEPRFDRAGAEAFLWALGETNAAMVAGRAPSGGATPDSTSGQEDAGAEHTGGGDHPA